MSGGLVKACVQRKNCSVSEKIEFLIKYQTELKVYMQLLKRSMVREVYFFCNGGKIWKRRWPTMETIEDLP